MFGWRSVGGGRSDRKRYGFTVESFSSGLWLNLYWGNSFSAFTHYTRNRHTGPAENRGVLAHFFGGPDRRPRASGYVHGFKVAAAKPIPSAFHNDYADECNCRQCQASPAARALLQQRGPRYAER